MSVLENIHGHQDLIQLNAKQRALLCDEIRDFLVSHLSQTGGHVSSNMGVVELTVALETVFDTEVDRLVFDVGHQSYVHKILSGRADRMDTLRQFGGISGFPKRSESEFDAFDTGHSSTSVSAALGMARARDIAGEKHNIIALFGDGALTGGEIYEAMNDAGHSKTPLTLILNDNAMSISKNVGAVSKHLRKIRINRVYFSSKRKISGFLNKIPGIGKPIRMFIEKIKSILRRYVITTTVFEDLGFKYIGPIDGHNLKSLIDCLQYAKSENKPVLLHVCTQKGKGYTPAEKDPSSFHGVGTFDASDGKLPPLKESYSMQFGKTLTGIAKDNEKVVAITCAMPDGTGLVEFSKLYKDRFFDVGIAEQHGVTFAAGLAVSGFVPVIPLYSTFLQRAYDQALHDVCLQNLHVVFPIDRAGIVGADGETHQGVYDISYLSTMPNMTVLSASSFAQLDSMLRYAINEHNGPIAIRYPRGNTESSYDTSDFEYGKAYTRKDGSDVSIITSGRMLKRAEEIAEALDANGISARITELPTIYPFNEDAIIKATENTKLVITLEDNIKSGGMGEHIAEILLSHGVSCKFRAFAFPTEPIVHGTVDELDKKYGMDTVSVSEYITKELQNG